MSGSGLAIVRPRPVRHQFDQTGLRYQPAARQVSGVFVADHQCHNDVFWLVGARHATDRQAVLIAEDWPPDCRSRH